MWWFVLGLIIGQVTAIWVIAITTANDRYFYDEIDDSKEVISNDRIN